VPKLSMADKRDLAVQAMLAGQHANQDFDPAIAPLLRIAQDLRDLPRENFKARLKTELERKSSMPTQVKPVVSPIPEGYHTLTPYLVVKDAPATIDFARQVFGAEETFRTSTPAGGIHAEVRSGDSMLMIGGGTPESGLTREPMPTALHIYVEDTDAAYQRALEAGGVPLQAPADQFYGERSGGVKDQAGNHWYIATWKGESYVPEGMRRVTPYLHPLRAEPVIDFLKRAFGAEELAKYASPDGVVHHAKIRIGDSILEMGEAGAPSQPMPNMFYMYVPHLDSGYTRPLPAGATSISPPAHPPDAHPPPRAQ